MVNEGRYSAATSVRTDVVFVLYARGHLAATIGSLPIVAMFALLIHDRS